MNFFGNHIGHAVDKAGKRKVVQELSIEVYSWMSIHKLQENMNGLIGEYKHISKNQFPIFGKRKYQINIHMMMKLYSRSSERLQLTKVLEE